VGVRVVRGEREGRPQPEAPGAVLILAPSAVAVLVRHAGAATARDHLLYARAFPEVKRFRVSPARPELLAGAWPLLGRLRQPQHPIGEHLGLPAPRPRTSSTARCGLRRPCWPPSCLHTPSSAPAPPGTPGRTKPAPGSRPPAPVPTPTARIYSGACRDSPEAPRLIDR